MSSRPLKFAVVGGVGTVLNLALMAGLVAVGCHYLVASVVATEVTIATNFVCQERWVFHDLRGGSRYHRRAVKAALFNNLEYLVRAPFLMLLVEVGHANSVLAQAVTLGAAFMARFFFSLRFVYSSGIDRVDAGVHHVPEGANL